MDRLNPTGPGSWVWPIVIVTLAQSTVAMMIRVLPLFAVPLTLAVGVAPEAAGQMSAATSLGSMMFFLWGHVVLQRVGDLGQIRLGILLTAAALGLCLLPDWRLILLGAFLIGVGYGPSAPAGSALLMRIVPASRRNVVFSIKQAGVPLGGLVAGLLLPVIGTTWGVSAALCSAVAIALLMAWALGLGGGQLENDAAAATKNPLPLASLLFAPLRLVGLIWSTPALRQLSLVGLCLAAAQGVLLAYYPVLLVEAAGWSLTEAGAAFALLQGVGVGGRVAVGWLSDRSGEGGRMLSRLALASGATMLALAVTGPGTPVAVVLLLAALAGVTVISWNGVYLTELAMAAPGGEVAAVTSAGTLVLFAGYVLSPLLAQAATTIGGSYGLAFLLTGAIPCGAGLWLWRLNRRAADRTG